MNPSEVSYSFDMPYPVMLQRGRAAVIKLPCRRDGQLAAPASGTVSLYDPAGTAIISASAVTITDSIATYSISAGTLPATLTLGEAYQLVWELVLADGTTRTIDQEAAVIRRPLVPVVDDSMLESRYPNLSRDRAASVTTYQQWIDEAWKEIIGKLISEGRLPYLIKSGWAFRTAHIDKALSLFFRAAGKSQGERGNYLELARIHEAAWESAWKAINFTTDDDHDGRVDEPGSRTGNGVVMYPGSAPTYRAPMRNPRF